MKFLSKKMRHLSIMKGYIYHEVSDVESLLSNPTWNFRIEIRQIIKITYTDKMLESKTIYQV